MCAMVLLLIGVSSARAQNGAGRVEDRRLEQYLTDHGLLELLATQLRDRLETTRGKERIELANRLGGLYVAMLDERPGPDVRRRVEALGRSLLESVPEAESAELRLSLAKASYLSAEVVAERYRLRLASPAEAEEAERTMRAVGALFQSIGTKANRSIEVLERREETADDRELRTVRAKLADARRIRSLAMYYAGWSSYYVGLLSGVSAHADEALRHFGWLLNASEGTAASVDRASNALLRFEHVSRAAMGAALCESLKGRTNIAEQWLDLLEQTDDLPESIREQLFPRRLTVLAEARRWADLNWQLTRHRGLFDDGLLPVREARLAAVYALTALGRQDLPERARPVLEEIARESLSDLVSAGQVTHVLDLASQFGTAQIGERGFIVNYVRGLQSFDRAKALHADSGEPTDEPSSRDAVRVAYREVADMILAAVETDDAKRFPEQLGNARLIAGLSLYYAGEFEAAAKLLEAAHANAPSREQAEEALWLVVIAIDHAVEEGRDEFEPELDRLTTLYLQTYPGGDRAAKLLLRRAASGAMSDERAVQVLLGVEPESPLFASARRHAGQLLYKIYRKSSRGDRDFAALQFVTVAEQVLAMDRRLVHSTDAEEAAASASRVVGHVRQILDALLHASSPDLVRAEAALETLQGVAAQSDIDLSELEAELTYRRLQIAVYRNDERMIASTLDRLHAIGGVFSGNADRLVYDRARRLWSMNPTDAVLARRVVQTGERVALQFDENAVRRREVASLYDAIASAAAVVWKSEQDDVMRDIAISRDQALLAAGHKTESSLRRLALHSESAGQTEQALDAWRIMLAGVTVSSDNWYEARYESLRLLAAVDRTRAVEVMHQYVLLHPEYGPEPWGEKLKNLDATLSRAPKPGGSTIVPETAPTQSPGEGRGR
jgi:tetratricopeptide (TPR) repeat protein